MSSDEEDQHNDYEMDDAEARAAQHAVMRGRRLVHAGSLRWRDTASALAHLRVAARRRKPCSRSLPRRAWGWTSSRAHTVSGKTVKMRQI